MAIINDQINVGGYMRDRMLDDLVMLPHQPYELLIPGNGELNQATINKHISKIYNNFYFLNSMLELKRPVMSTPAFGYDDSVFVKSTEVRSGGNTITSVNIAKSKKEENAFYNIYTTANAITVTKTVIVDGVFTVVPNSSFTVTNLYTTGYGGAVVSFDDVTIHEIVDAAFDDDTSTLFVLTKQNVYKIDLYELVYNDIHRMTLIEMSQGYKDILYPEAKEISYIEKSIKYHNKKIDCGGGFVVVYDESIKTPSTLCVFKILDYKLNSINTVVLNRPVGTEITDIFVNGTTLYAVKNTPEKELITIDLKDIANDSTFSLYRFRTEEGYIANDVRNKITPLVNTISYTGIVMLDDVLFYTGFGVAAQNQTATRLYRSFNTKLNRVIDSRPCKGADGVVLAGLNNLDVRRVVVDGKEVDIATMSAGGKIINLVITTPKVTSVIEDFNIYGLNNAAVHGEEYVQPMVINKSFYKILYDHIYLCSAIQGRFYAVVLTANSTVGHNELLYNGLKYVKEEDLEIPVKLHEHDNYISINEVLCVNTYNRCMGQIIKIQEHLVKLVQSNLGDLALMTIQLS